MPLCSVSKSVLIDADRDKVFEAVADYNTWSTWSPWLISEPNASVEVSSIPNQVGSTYRWRGQIIGEGELEHLRLVPGERVDDALRFFKPRKSSCTTSVILEPHGKQTKATWTMDANFPWFLFFLVPMMRQIIGMDFQRGLNMLKEWLETGRILSKTTVMGTESVGPLRVAGLAGRSKVDDINNAMETSLREVRAEFAREGLPTDGPMIAVYTRFLIKEGIFEYILGYAIPETLILPLHSPLKDWKQPKGQALHVRHVGSYRHLGNAWSAANQIARHKRLRLCKTGTYEIYTTSPNEVPEESLQTDLYLPCKRTLA